MRGAADESSNKSPFNTELSWYIQVNLSTNAGQPASQTSRALTVPRMSDVMPSLVTKTLSSSSLPVKSSATTYRLGDTPLATSSMYWSTPPGGTPQAAQAEQELDQEGDREEVREAGEGWGLTGSSQITPGRVRSAGREERERRRREQV